MKYSNVHRTRIDLIFLPSKKCVSGCMAERVKHKLLDYSGIVNVVAGPDSYRDLPRLLAVARHGSVAINVQLSLDETYADIDAVRADPTSKTAFL